MCGRYALYDTSKSEFKIPHNLVGKNYNVTPSVMVPVVVENNEFKLMPWMFKVPWAEKLNIINARSETLDSKIVFKNEARPFAGSRRPKKKHIKNVLKIYKKR